MDVISIGLASAVVTEVLKFVPFLRQGTLTKAITAIVVTLAISYLSARVFSFEGFVTALIVALTTYKAVISPVAKSVGLVTQS